MPTAGDQLPGGVTDLARQIAELRRQINELRAARRAGYTTVTNGRTTFTAESGWQIILDPDSDLPIMYFRDPNGAEMAALNATGAVGRPGFNLSSGPISDELAPDWRWVTFGGETESGANNNWVTSRFQTSNINRRIGGWLYLDPRAVQFGLVDSDTGINQILQIATQLAVFSGARLHVTPPASTSPGLTVAALAGHTGTLMTLYYAGTPMVTVGINGAASFAGQLSAQTLNIGSGSSSIGGDLTVTGASSVGADQSIGGAVKKTGETWQTPAFAATWASGTALGGNATFRGLQYRKTADDEVRVVGAAVSSGAGTTITTLPAGYRPPANKRALIRAYFSSGSGTPTSGWAQVTEGGVIAVGSSISGYTIANGTQCYIDGTFPLGNLA
ncbi:hypothetical protein ACIOHE_15585 [Streptomyces sp. NPDC087851]|uniref:hypothetical protein n=1 Tax=Streptomyces sp. NPDC087851 TaxID=3365810 RepID=UPI0038156435